MVKYWVMAIHWCFYFKEKITEFEINEHPELLKNLEEVKNESISRNSGRKII